VTAEKELKKWNEANKTVGKRGKHEKKTVTRLKARFPPFWERKDRKNGEEGGKQEGENEPKAISLDSPATKIIRRQGVT